MKLDLSQKQIKDLSNGKTVQLKYAQIGKGQECTLHPENIKKITKAYHAGKGVRLSLSGAELGQQLGSGVFGKAFDKKLKKIGIKKAVDRKSVV